MNTKQFDIVIIGAGLVGSAMVVALQQLGFSIAVLEKYLPDVAVSRQVDQRPLTLAYSSQVALSALGLWDDLADQACPIEQVHVSEQGALGATHFLATEYHVPALGYVLPYSLLQQTLYQSAAQQEGVSIIPINDVVRLDCTEQGCNIAITTAQGDQHVSADCVIACDGTHSAMRDLLGIKSKQTHHSQTAVIAHMLMTQVHHKTAYERFTDRGVMALLPLWDPQAMRLVWTLPTTEAEQVALWSSEQLTAFIIEQFGGRLHVKQDIAIDKQYPLQTVIAQQQIQPGCVLLGNAAHTLYPLAAQGFNLALRDVAALSEVLLKARQQSQSLGLMSVLESYIDWRKTDQKQTIALTQRLSDLFALPFIKPWRGLALLALDSCSPLKKRLARRTMGVAGKMPRLLRGLPLA